MKEVVYGYREGEKNISYDISRINYVSEPSEDGEIDEWLRQCGMSEMSSTSRDYDDRER